MEKHYFTFLWIIDSATEKVFQFKMWLMSIYNKTLYFNE